MITKKIKSKNETFTMVSDLMIESTKLNSNEKLLLSYILRWQMANKQCRLSNKALGVKLGLSIDSIKRIITKLKDFSFFVSEKHSHYNEFNTWCNYKIMRVNESELSIFLIENTVEKITDINDVELDEDIDDVIVTPEAVLSLPGNYIQPVVLTAEAANNEANTALIVDDIQPVSTTTTTTTSDDEDEYDEEDIYSDDEEYDEEVEMLLPKAILQVPVAYTTPAPTTIIDDITFELDNDFLDLPFSIIDADKESEKKVDNDAYFQKILDKNWDEIKTHKKEKRSKIFMSYVDDSTMWLPSAEFQNYIHNIEPFAKDWYTRNEPLAA